MRRWFVHEQVVREASEIQAAFHPQGRVVAELGRVMVQPVYREADTEKLVPAREGTCQSDQGVRLGVSEESSSVRLDRRRERYTEEDSQTQTTVGA